MKYAVRKTLEGFRVLTLTLSMDDWGFSDLVHPGMGFVIHGFVLCDGEHFHAIIKFLGG